MGGNFGVKRFGFMNVYYKIYRFYQKGLSVQQISATMHIPEKTIKDFIARLKDKGRKMIKSEEELEEIVESFLDYTISKHHRYVVIDFSGTLTEQFLETVENGLEDARKISLQVLTIKLDGVLEIDAKGMQALIDFKERMGQGGKIVVLLSPSDSVEEYVKENKIEDVIRIFGTQSAFEDYLFRATFDKNR